MKQILKFFTASLLLGAIITGCSKSGTTTPVVPEPTSLKLTVLDANANAVFGASVKLYPTSTDWLNSTNQVGATQTTNLSGQVTFTGLSAQKYYWDVVSGCQNNYGSSTPYTTTSILTANVVNTANAAIAGNGTIKLVNNSSNPYAIYLDGNSTPAISSAPGNDTKYLYSISTGTHTIRVLQLSGYAFFATEKTYTCSVTCGGTFTVTYP